MFTVIDISTKETLFTFHKRADALKAIHYLNEWLPERRVGLKRGRAHNDKC